MILEYKKYASDGFVDEIRQQVAPFVKKEQRQTTQNRDGITVNITQTKELNNLDLKLSAFFSDLCANIIKQRFKPQFTSGDSGYEYHLYRAGDMCHPHSDGEVDNFSGQLRYATVILFLTDNNDGELVFPVQNLEVKPEKGKLVVFPPYGYIPHYSKPSLNDREIVMTWFIYNDMRVIANAT
jgi:hypothetical protein